ncbi:MAG: DUF6452 family protein [Bacteroidaceae bacterium]|nr:DUF6452 family protein [Bacteroidaceae bacterium]
MKKTLKHIILLTTCLLGIVGCDEMDCSLNNIVECKIAFYNAKREPVALTDTLTITAAGTDSILYNRGVRTSSVGIPLSYFKEKDTLMLSIYGEDYMILERLIIKKRSFQHVESIDCPLKVFHYLQGVESTHQVIDSVKIASHEVNYDNGENIQIYLHSGD